jgi:hypothetical protein
MGESKVVNFMNLLLEFFGSGSGGKPRFVARRGAGKFYRNMSFVNFALGSVRWDLGVTSV